ncbi:3'-5' exonuclease-like [Syzygium oleosum]|uniref:3'-5' exonuclease-like n=1 Tax=Syzygium oleosum TaxID=219896 RepID=UPI0011D1BA33|nr:3'-5' exonuclease-like [Syzygium oleosum]
MRTGRTRTHTAFDPANSRYNVTYDGRTIETTVTDEATVVNQWIQETLSLHTGSPTVVGLDIEWRPNVIRSMSNKTATLQLCIDKRCLIVQLFYIDYVPELLKDFVRDPNFTFVGVEVDGDVDKLKVEYGLECAKHADVRELAKLRWPGRFRKPGLKDLALEVVGLVMDKPKHVSMSNWEARVLNINQVEYACIDAYASYKLGTALL